MSDRSSRWFTKLGAQNASCSSRPTERLRLVAAPALTNWIEKKCSTDAALSDEAWRRPFKRAQLASRLYSLSVAVEARCLA